ncbi:MAG: ATP phosphoribosyltransferase [Christensenellaceae bacterium]|jgi:ATP phosphoribosyltransferase|nr:ATP phosphoribosyltransferase [Christensenellaceae bacterium]
MNGEGRLTFALAKGRLAEKAVELLERAGIDCRALRDQGRRLVFEDERGETAFMLVKPADVATYVDHGVADLGIAGKDSLMEENRPLYEMLDLGFGRCRLALAGYPGTSLAGRHVRVATKYPFIAQELFSKRGCTYEIIRLNGSVELGPIVGLSDVILDIVESGATLKANGLAVLEEICPVSARLVVNRVSLKTKAARIRPLIERLGGILGEGRQ